MNAAAAARPQCRTGTSDHQARRCEINAADYRFLKLLAEFDDNHGWWGDGIKSFAHWLNYMIGLNEVVAREKVRVARALTDLPLIDEAFRLGKLSYSKVRAITRIGTPNNQEFLLMIARKRHCQPHERLAGKYRLCQRLDAEVDPDELWKKDRAFYYRIDEDGMYLFEGRCPRRRRGHYQGDQYNAKSDPPGSAVMTRNRTNRTSHTAQHSTGNENASQNVSAETFIQDINPPDILDDQASALTQLAEHYLETANKSSPHTSLSEKYQVFAAYQRQ